MARRDALPVRLCRWVEGHGTLMALLALGGYVSNAVELAELAGKAIDLLAKLIELAMVIIG